MTGPVAPVVDAPSAPQETLALLNESAPSGTATGQQSPVASTPSEKPKRKGGFPKGAKRGPGGKKIAGDAPSETTHKVYDGTIAENQGAPPPGAQRVGGPALAMADPALVDACKPHVKNLVKAITGLLARLTGNASMRATDEEAELLAETGAPLMVLHMPDVAQASPEAAFGAAVLNYAVPRLGAFSGTPDVASTGASSPPPPPPPPSPAPAPSETAVVVSPLMPTGAWSQP